MPSEWESGKHRKSPVATSLGQLQCARLYANLFNILSHLLLSMILYFLHFKNELIKDGRDHPGVMQL